MAFLFMSRGQPQQELAQRESISELAPAHEQPTQAPPSREQATPPQQRIVPPLGQSGSACETRNTPIGLIRAPLKEVCVKIRTGDIDEAFGEWSAFRRDHYPAADLEQYNPMLLQLAAETKVVADTFADQAKKLDDPDMAQLARGHGQLVETWYVWDYQNVKPPQP